MPRRVDEEDSVRLRARIRAESGPSHSHGRWRVSGRIADCPTCYPNVPRVLNQEREDPDYGFPILVHLYSGGEGGTQEHPGLFKDCSLEQCEELYDRLRSDTSVVDCDIECQAKTSPEGLAELEDALIHWREHTWTGGCSHGR